MRSAISRRFVEFDPIHIAGYCRPEFQTKFNTPCSIVFGLTVWNLVGKDADCSQGRRAFRAYFLATGSAEKKNKRDEYEFFCGG
jgi:hypothetical protein